MLTRPFIAILCMGAAMTAAAQDLTTEITVDRTVVTELPDAEPLKSVFPVMPQLPATDFRLQPAMYSRASVFSPLAGNLNAPLYTGINAPIDYRGYAFGGYFPAFNAEAALGYRFVNTTATQAGAALSYNGFSYKSRLSEPKATVSSNTFRAQADASHRFDAGATLTATVDYMYAGLKSPLFDDESQKQSISAFRAKAGVSGGRQITYGIEIDYSHFGLGKDITSRYSANIAPASDDRFGINGKASFAMGHEGKTSLSIGLGADFLKATGFRPGQYDVSPTDETSGILTVNPALQYGGKNANVKIGAIINFGINSPDKVFHIAPDVTLCWTPTCAFDAYVTADGGERFNDLRWQYEQSVFAPGATASTRSFTKLRSRIGFNAHLFNDFRIGAFAGYGYVNNLPVYALTLRGADATGSVLLPLIFATERAKSWYFGGNIGYDFGRYASLSAEGRYYTKGDFSSADRAHMVLDASLKIFPIEKLSFEVTYSLRGRRHYTAPMAGCVNMHNSSLLDLTANYAITERFSAFASVRNLLNRRCLSTPLVESRPLHGLVGVSYLF